MASSSNDWYFTKEQLETTPSKQCGVEPYKELSYRQQAANFIQDMGQKLKVSQLCINTAIVYMHRFYVFHSFTRFPWNSIAAAALFLAAKVEEQPRKLEHVIRVVNLCKNPHDTSFDTTSERYLAQSQDLVFNENILLQTLGFDVAIDHPHTHVVRCCHLVRASKDLAQTSYFMASNREWRDLTMLSPEQSGTSKAFFLEAYSVATKSLHLTTMCLQYKPTVVACFCIHFVCKWSNWEIPLSNEKKEWFSYVDETVTSDLLEQLTKEFLFIYDRCPSRLKEKIMAIGDGLSLNHSSGHPSSPFEPDKKFGPFPTAEQIQKDPHHNRPHHGDSNPKIASTERTLRLPHEASSSGQHRDREREYREKKERERMGHHIKPPPPNAASSKHAPPHGHHGHAPPVDPKLNKHARPPSSNHPSNPRIEPRDILREATRDIGLRDYKEHSRDSLSSKETLPNREINQQVRDKRDYVHQRQEVKPVGASDSVNHDKRVDPNRQRPVDPKLQARRREVVVKPYNKLESDIKKHLSAAIHDKNSFLHKPVNSTSQKIKSPFASEPKAVPNQSASQTIPTTVMKTEVKPEPHNGSNSNGSAFNLPIIESDIKTKFDASVQEETIVAPAPVKKPSLFSPEKSPPPQKKPKTKTPPSSGKKSTDIPIATVLPVTPAFELPPQQNSGNTKRNRTSSTNSEPELRPVMKKIDQVQGFENIMRDSSIGIKLHQVPDIITPISDIKQEKVNLQSSIAKELKPPDLIPPFNTNTQMVQPILNGIETNPSLISSLLKETPTIPHLPTVAATTSVAPESKSSHKEHKKNKKEKHKHKDKERSREEKEKKKKHKDKDREKHKHKSSREDPGIPAQPIKITIPRDKFQPVQPVVVEHPQPSLGLKIKIPKDRIKTDGIGESSSIGGGIKLKISKDVINNFSGEHMNSKKRERDRNSPSNGPPNKIPKSNHNRFSSKNSYNKVSNLNNNNTEAAVHNVVQTSMYNGVNHMPPQHPVYPNQNAPPPPPPNYYFNYPPPNMQIPMNVPPHYMYQQYYPPTGYMYPTAEMYAASNASMGGELPPPLPQDPPPNNPPPPPPDF